MVPPWLFAPWFLSLKEMAFFLAGFLVLLACSSDRLALRYLGDGNVPPGVVVWDALVVCSFDDDHRGAGPFSGCAESVFEVFAGARSGRPGTEARGVRREIDG